MFLLDVQKGNKPLEDNKTLSYYITEYQVEARNDRIHRFTLAIGVDEKQLRDFMNRHITTENTNEFGLFDKLKNTVDRGIARGYFERTEGKAIKIFRIPAKIDTILR